MKGSNAEKSVLKASRRLSALTGDTLECEREMQKAGVCQDGYVTHCHLPLREPAEAQRGGGPGVAVHWQLSAQLGGPEPWVLSDFQQLGV